MNHVRLHYRAFRLARILLAKARSPRARYHAHTLVLEKYAQLMAATGGDYE